MKINSVFPGGKETSLKDLIDPNNLRFKFDFVCSKCGHPVAPYQHFCTFCGHRLKPLPETKHNYRGYASIDKERFIKFIVKELKAQEAEEKGGAE